jgi:hypothetical protein
MALRFRRSVKIVPGVRVNFGKRGVSVSAGVRGATITAGKHGVYGNAGIPGTGLSFRSKLRGKTTNSQLVREQRKLERELEKQEQLERRREALSNVQLSLNDNGSINIINSFGEALSRADLKLLWEQKSDHIREWLLQQAEEINGDVEQLSQIHIDTPSPDLMPQYDIVPFQEQRPKKPKPFKEESRPVKSAIPQLGFFAKLSQKKRELYEIDKRKAAEQFRIELDLWKKRQKERKQEYIKSLKLYEKKVKLWEQRKELHEKKENIKLEEFPERLAKDVKLMESVLHDSINTLSWPRETIVSYEIRNYGKEIWLDVDLPEIEDIPQKIANIAASRRKLNIKNKSQKQLRLEYSSHIHGIAFRLTGIVFATLPSAEYVVISGYSQRIDPSTGKINDDYLFSFKVNRKELGKIVFSSLERVDPIVALASFEHVRKMTATGIFKAITPFTPDS